MTKRERLLIDAREAGYTIRESPGGLVRILRTHKRTGKTLQGVILYYEGTAIDATVDFAVARGIRGYNKIRALLGLRSERPR
jgi:hypothetical protein